MEARMPYMVTLPIVSIEVGECNFKTVIAKTDLRPVHGSLDKLTILDFSGNTCPTFAAPQFRGTSKLQILDDRTIRRINNIGEASDVGQLTAAELLTVQNQIETLGAVQLTTPNTPMCMDAPSSSIAVHQGSQERFIWTRDASPRVTDLIAAW